MFKSIRLRLTLYFALLIAMILLGTTYLLYQNAYTNQLSNIDGSLHVIINDLTNDMREDELEEIYEDIEDIQKKFKMGLLHVRIVSYDLTTETGSVIAKSSETKNSVFANFNLQKDYIKEDILYQTFNSHRTAMQRVSIDDRTVQFVQASVAISFKSNTTVTLIAVNTIIFIFSILGAYILISRTLLPVDNVVMSVNEIKAYDYTKRVSTKNIPNEIKKLVETFNKLLVRHQESFSKISQFSSDVSHELKTPLTTIRGEIEVGLRRERNSEEYQKILEKSLSKIIEIQKFIDGLLFLAKTDKLEIRSSFKELYIDEIITECVEELSPIAHKKAINIEITTLVPVTVRGNCKLLKIACLNILKNAILYSHKDTKIEIEVKEHKLEYIVIIKDQGIGMTKEDLEHIFDRFYRVDKIKSRESGGTGLGLSIVKMILDIHGFDIVIESEVGRGSLVKILVEKDSKSIL
ncbi:MAG: hypothetical protein K0U38_10650 [Epsilonproteobacteria bacterium]|nr:hypothetical protein [Campylobacterota bacterium]